MGLLGQKASVLTKSISACHCIISGPPVLHTAVETQYRCTLMKLEGAPVLCSCAD